MILIFIFAIRFRFVAFQQKANEEANHLGNRCHDRADPKQWENQDWLEAGAVKDTHVLWNDLGDEQDGECHAQRDIEQDIVVFRPNLHSESAYDSGAQCICDRVQAEDRRTGLLDSLGRNR